MDSTFTPVSYDHREMIEEEINKCTHSKVFFFDTDLKLNCVEGQLTRLVEFKDRGWFINVYPASLIRIDRIITVNGRPGPAYDEYDSYANACMDCKGGNESD